MSDNVYAFTQEDAVFFRVQMVHYAVKADTNKVKYDAAVRQINALEGIDRRSSERLQALRKLNDIYQEKLFLVEYNKKIKNNKNNKNIKNTNQQQLQGCKTQQH